MSQRPFHQCTRVRRGFTLIEALAAIAVIAITVPIVLQGFNIAGAIASSARLKTEATAIAQTAMDEILSTTNAQVAATNGTTSSTSNASLSGQEMRGLVPFNWVASYTDWSSNSSAAITGIQQLDVRVTWLFRNQEKELVLSTLIYSPDPALQQANDTAATAVAP